MFRRNEPRRENFVQGIARQMPIAVELLDSLSFELIQLLECLAGTFPK